MKDLVLEKADRWRTLKQAARVSCPEYELCDYDFGSDF